MDWVLKSALTAAAVMLVLTAAQRFGARVAGLVAALPLVTAPALAWSAHERGTAFAIGAAISSVAACAMLAVFALGFSIASRRRGGAVAVIAGTIAAALMALPVLAASESLSESLALALLCCAMVCCALPRSAGVAASRPSPAPNAAWVAGAVGLATALLAATGPSLGHVVTGLLSSLPLIGATAAVLEHARGGHRASTQFLRGYVVGLFSKAAFGAAFALTAPHVGSTAGLVLACGSVALMSMIERCGWSRRSAPRLVAARGSAE